MLQAKRQPLLALLYALLLSCTSTFGQTYIDDIETVDAPSLKLWKTYVPSGTQLYQSSAQRSLFAPSVQTEHSGIHWFQWLDSDALENNSRWALRHEVKDTVNVFTQIIGSSNDSIDVRPLYSARQYACPTYGVTESGRLQVQGRSNPDEEFQVTAHDEAYAHGVDSLGNHHTMSKHCLYIQRPWVHLVFDLDETLVWAKCGNPDSPSIIRHGYGPDCMADGVVELLRWLRTVPRIRVSFWSASEANRVRSLLNSLLVTPETAALDIAEMWLSVTDLTLFDASGNRIVPAKDLRKVSPDISNIVLIDDKPNPLRSQDKHWIALADSAALFSSSILDGPLEMDSLAAVAIMAAHHPYRNDEKKKASIVRHMEGRKIKPFAIAGLIALLLQHMQTGLSLEDAWVHIHGARQAYTMQQPFAAGSYAIDWVWDDEIIEIGMKTLRQFNPLLALPDFSWLREGVYHEDLERDEGYVIFRGKCLYPHPANDTWMTRPCPAS